MVDFLFAFTGVVLQVLSLTVMIFDFMIGAAALVLQALLKELPRSSEDEPRRK